MTRHCLSRGSPPTLDVVHKKKEKENVINRLIVLYIHLTRLSRFYVTVRHLRVFAVLKTPSAFMVDLDARTNAIWIRVVVQIESNDFVAGIAHSSNVSFGDGYKISDVQHYADTLTSRRTYYDEF